MPSLPMRFNPQHTLVPPSMRVPQVTALLAEIVVKVIPPCAIPGVPGPKSPLPS